MSSRVWYEIIMYANTRFPDNGKNSSMNNCQCVRVYMCNLMYLCNSIGTWTNRLLVNKSIMSKKCDFGKEFNFLFLKQDSNNNNIGLGFSLGKSFLGARMCNKKMSNIALNVALKKKKRHKWLFLIQTRMKKKRILYSRLRAHFQHHIYHRLPLDYIDQ